MRHLKGTLCILALSCVGFAPFSHAADDEWHFEVTPYLLAAGLDGTVGARGVTAEMDVSFSDIWDDLDAGFMGLFTARRGPWMFGLEAVYMKLEDEAAKSVTGPFGQVTASGALAMTSSLYVYQGSVGYRVLDDSVKVDLIGAVRHTRLDLDLKVQGATDPGIVFPGGATTAGGSESWTDLVAGVNAVVPLNEQWSLVGYADIGGGGSDLTYQVIAGANWAFSDAFAAKFGYRVLAWDYEDGGTVWDVTASGPYLGLGIRF
jgi:hypothetical protein